MPQVDVWIGTVSDQETLDRFLEETHSDDNAPISQFAVSQNDWFYDHDFLEVSYFSNKTNLQDALESMSFGPSYASEVRATAGRRKFNVIFLMINEFFDKPISISRDGIQADYIGRFDYDPKAVNYGTPKPPPNIYIHILGGKTLPTSNGDTDCIMVDDNGLTIGKPVSYGPYIDVSSEVPDTAHSQAWITINAGGLWELQDHGENGLTKLGSDDFDGSKWSPWPGIKFSVGSVEFLWSDQPKES